MSTSKKPKTVLSLHILRRNAFPHVVKPRFFFLFFTRIYCAGKFSKTYVGTRERRHSYYHYIFFYRDLYVYL